MKQILFIFLLLFSFAWQVVAETNSKGFVFWPVGESSYKANLTISAVEGDVTAQPYGQDDPAQTETMPLVGIEIGLDCPWFQFGENALRQQLNLTSYEQQNQNMMSLEINPHWYFIDTELIRFGFGPGFGWIDATDKTTRKNVNYFTLQYSASVGINLGFLYLGAEYRHQESSERGLGESYNNERRMVKLGINF